MPLHLEETIPVSTRLGTSVIELYLGDITDQPILEKVDLIFVSAYPGAYKLVPGSLMHALKTKLNIDVSELAQHKELDLRKMFSCWMSGALPDDKPFGKLVCFENTSADSSTSMTDQVARMFGAMMLIISGMRNSIMSPILATGGQGHPYIEMFDVMVESSISWMKAGLPLTCLKLVLFTRNPQEDRKTLYGKAIENFKKKKTREVSTSQTQPLMQRTKIVNNKTYKVMEPPLGGGTYGKVYLIKDEINDDIRALKIVDLFRVKDNVEAQLQAHLKEKDLLEKLNKCNQVVTLYDWEYRKQKKKLYLVLEYGETDLENFLKNLKHLNPVSVRYFWKEMVVAVDTMHKEGVIHADLKPSNFVLVKGSVKLCDFGISKALKQGQTSILTYNARGTAFYHSPEALVNINPALTISEQYKLSKRSDVWSLGCILYQMVYGKTPFEDEPNVFQAIADPNFVITFEDNQNKAAVDVLKKCLMYDVTKRPTTEELFQHAYLADTDLTSR